MVFYKRNLEKEARLVQKKYDNGTPFTVTDIKKLRADPALIKKIELDQHDSWSDLMLKARFARVEKFRDSIQKKDFSNGMLAKMSSQMPDLAVETINKGNLSFKQFMAASSGLAREHWSKVKIQYPEKDDDSGIEWLLRKSINMQNPELYNELIEKYELEPENILSTKMMNKTSFRQQTKC